MVMLKQNRSKSYVEPNEPACFIASRISYNLKLDCLSWYLMFCWTDSILLTWATNTWKTNMITVIFDLEG
jgi:hypothetical protein